jgi:hypothetical protein
VDEITGYWWRPEAPAQRIAGALRIESGGSEMSLELLGSFMLLYPEPGVAYPIDESYDCLRGEVHRSTIKGVAAVTLWGCQWRGGLPDLLLQPSVAIMGDGHVGESDTAQFPGALVEFTSRRGQSGVTSKPAGGSRRHRRFLV